MYEEDVTNSVETHPHSGAGEHSSVLKYVLLAVALLYVLASMYFMYTLKSRLDAVDQKQQNLESAQTELTARLHSTKSEFKEALTSEVGLTKEEIARRAAELERQQKAGEAKLTAAQSPAGPADRRGQRGSNRREDRSRRRQDRHREDPDRSAGNQSEAGAHHWRPWCSERIDRAYLGGTGRPEAQGRP